MPAPYSSTPGITLSQTDARYAALAGTSTQNFACDALVCTSIVSKDNADLGQPTISLIGDHLYYKDIPSSRSAPANTTSVKEKFDTIATQISNASHIFLTGVAKNVMSTTRSFVQWTGDPVMSHSGVVSVLLPVGIRIKRITMRWYTGSAVAFAGLTSLPVKLSKFSVGFEGSPIVSNTQSIGDLYNFTALNTGSSDFPAVNVDTSTLNSGGPYTLTAGEGLIVYFQRAIDPGNPENSSMRNAEVQVCLYCEVIT